MPVRNWSHADFPESTATAEGIREIDAAAPYGRRILVLPHVQYAVKDGRALHLVVIQPGLDPGTGEQSDLEAEVSRWSSTCRDRRGGNSSSARAWPGSPRLRGGGT